MVEVVSKWVLAQVAANKAADIRADIKRFKQEQVDFEKSTMVRDFKQSISTLRSLLPAGTTRPLTAAYKNFWQRCFGMFGYYIPEYKQRDFSKLPERRREVTQMVEKAIKQAEDRFIARSNDSIIPQHQKTLSELKQFGMPGVKAMKGEKVAHDFPVNLDGWYIDTRKLDELRIEGVERMKELFGGKAVPPDLLKNLLDGANSEWKNLHVVVMKKLDATNASAYWNPARRFIAIEIPTSKSPKYLVRRVEETVTHELRHFGQSLLSATLDIGDPWFTKRLPQPGMPSKKIRTPEFKQRGKEPNPKRQRGPSRTDQHHLDDVEFYTDMADAILRIQRELQDKDRMRASYDQEPLTDQERRAIFSRMVGSKVPADHKELVRYTSIDSYFRALKQYAKPKWKKAVGESWKKIFGGPALRVARLWMSRILRASYSRPPDGVVYIGVFLASMDKLKLIKNFGQAHGELHAHHMTVWHFSEGTEPPDYSKLPWGRDVALKVTGYAEDAKAQAVVVQPPSFLRPAGRTPHLTLSTQPGVAPAYSNDLIRHAESQRAPAVKGKLGWFGEDNKVHLTAPV